MNPGPGPTSMTSSPRSTSRNASGRTCSSTTWRHSGLAQNTRWTSFTAGLSPMETDGPAWGPRPLPASILRPGSAAAPGSRPAADRLVEAIAMTTIMPRPRCTRVRRRGIVVGGQFGSGSTGRAAGRASGDGSGPRGGRRHARGPALRRPSHTKAPTASDR